MTRPPMAGPMAKQSENETFKRRVARVELAVGLEGGGHCTARQRAADERQERRPPRRAARMSGSHGEGVISASAAKIAASTR